MVLVAHVIATLDVTLSAPVYGAHQSLISFQVVVSNTAKCQSTAEAGQVTLLLISVVCVAAFTVKLGYVPVTDVMFVHGEILTV